MMDTLCGLRFKLSVPSFYQVNRDQAEVLYGKALEFAGLTGEETVLDLYCGTGTITLCMAAKAKKVIGAEIVPPPSRTPKRTRPATALKTRNSSAATRRTSRQSWRRRACGRTSSPWTRPGRAWRRR